MPKVINWRKLKTEVKRAALEYSTCRHAKSKHITTYIHQHIDQFPSFREWTFKRSMTMVTRAMQQMEWDMYTSEKSTNPVFIKPEELVA
jgi:hypothetical protein